MEVKEAVRSAKAYVADVFGDDNSITVVNLEEVKFQDTLPFDRWEITVSYYRESGTVRNNPLQNALAGLAALGPQRPQRVLERVYKTVIVRDSDGEITAVTHRTIKDDD